MRASPVNGAKRSLAGTHPEGSDDGSRGPGRTAGERRPATFASLCSPSRPPSIVRNPGRARRCRNSAERHTSLCGRWIQARRLEGEPPHISCLRHVDTVSPSDAEQGNHRRKLVSVPAARLTRFQVGQLTQQSNVTRPPVAAHQTSGRIGRCLTHRQTRSLPWCGGCFVPTPHLRSLRPRRWNGRHSQHLSHTVPSSTTV